MVVDPIALYCSSLEESERIPLEEKVERAVARAQAAIAKYKPYKVVAACSGGHDSRTVAHLASKLPQFDGVFHIDTGIKIVDEPYNPETGVRELCAKYGWHLWVYRAMENTLADGTPDPQDYDKIVVEGCHGRGFPDAGFPGPRMHDFVFSRLKQRQIDRFLRDVKQEQPDAKVMFLTGVRMFESVRRWENIAKWGGVDVMGSAIYCNPIAEWTGTDKEAYIRDRAIPKSKIKEAGFCHSGECLCNCFKYSDLEMEFLRQECPQTWERIERLNREVEAQGYPFGYNEEPPSWWSKFTRGDLFYEEYADGESAPFCTTCLAVHQENEAMKEATEEIALVMEYGEAFQHAIALPAMYGVQGGQPFYTTQMPLGVLTKFAMFDETGLPDDNRVQRPLQESRVPGVAAYMLDNPDSWVFDAITVAIESEVHFQPDNPGKKQGQIRIPLESRIRVLDGQHRLKGIEKAIAAKPSLASEDIPVIIRVDCDLARMQQIFADQNRHGKAPNASQNISKDKRDKRAVIVMGVLKQVYLFDRYTDRNATTLNEKSKSGKMFCLNHLYEATKELLVGHAQKPVKEQIDVAVMFWEEVSKSIPDWQQVASKQVAASELRRDSLVLHGIVLKALGMWGAIVLREKNWQSKVKRLSSVDWARCNPQWRGIFVDEEGKVKPTKANAQKCVDKILRLL